MHPSRPTGDANDRDLGALNGHPDFPAQEFMALDIVARDDGMVMMAIGETAVAGSWMQAVAVATNLMEAAMVSACHVGASKETRLSVMTEVLLNSLEVSSYKELYEE